MFIPRFRGHDREPRRIARLRGADIRSIAAEAQAHRTKEPGRDCVHADSTAYFCGMLMGCSDEHRTASAFGPVKRRHLISLSASLAETPRIPTVTPLAARYSRISPSSEITKAMPMNGRPLAVA
jgi:hypothetical protein